MIRRTVQRASDCTHDRSCLRSLVLTIAALVLTIARAYDRLFVRANDRSCALTIVCAYDRSYDRSFVLTIAYRSNDR